MALEAIATAYRANNQYGDAARTYAELSDRLANQLDRFARQQLPSLAERMAQDERTLQESPSDPARQQLVREVQKRATQGLYSVAPLFNDAANQVGELLALEGTVRRVTPIDTVGATFDPHLHQAVSSEPSADHREGEIIEEFRRGYRLGERLLRPAMVKVAAA